MIRGTTPTHTFDLPIDTALIKSVRIVYAQNDVVIVTKCTEDCTLDGNSVVVTLTQEDTLKFDCKVCVQIQIRVLLQDGTAMASRPAYVDVEKCLDGEVLT